MKYLLSLMSTGETIQMIVHQHWIVLARAFVVSVLAAAVLILAAGLGAGLGTSAGHTLFLMAWLFVLLPVAYFLREVTQWQAQQYVVTSRRVMRVSGVLNKQVSDSNLDKVNDIVLRQSFLGRLFGFGDLEIITGSDVGVDLMPRIRHPLEFQKTLLDNKEDFDTLGRIGDGAAVTRDDIPATIDRLAEMKNRGVISDEEFARKKADLLARM
jgi:hypothetical protein